MESGEKTSPRLRGTTPEVEAGARDLRWSMTSAEWKLWQALRVCQVGGLKFRCQHPVGPFVLDFYCPACKLVVELDGDVHAGQVEQDEARTRHLESYGYQVLRFRNEEVLRDLPSVVERIAQAATEGDPGADPRHLMRQPRRWSHDTT